MNTIKPTYYTRHPDDTYSVADPQPTIQPVQQEPVALLDVFSGWSDIAEVEIIYNAAKKLPDGEYKLYAAPVSAEPLRPAKAAGQCEGMVRGRRRR